jgi:hypothetical protein
MLDMKHYVPILRWKQAEMLALRNLRDEDKTRITPIIEITPKSFLPAKRGKWMGAQPEPGKVLTHHAKEILRNWGYSPFFLELRHIEEAVGPIDGKLHSLSYITELGRSYQLKIVPVTGLERSVNYQSAVAAVVKEDKRGVCLRLSPSDVLAPEFSGQLRKILHTLDANVEDVDFLVDYGVYDPEAPLITALFQRVPELSGWRSLIVSRGAFPKDLQGFTPGTHTIRRGDWLTWKHEVSERKIPRRPSFSDYTIQYGQYREPVDNANPSASIRYTLDDEWLILRGEGIFNEDGPGRAQWNANAMLLLDRTDFYGETFSDGDSYIARMSRDASDHGSPMTWIRAGLNHHLTVVSRQVAAL